MSYKTEEKKEQTIHDLTPPEEFFKIINDFTNDIMVTFPEYSGIIQKWWLLSETASSEEKEKKTLFLFRHCIKTFPERFFDILYQNKDIFTEESEINTEFLPGIVFKQLWSCDISEKTRETIWKYLQLILFSVIGSVSTRSQLGDTAKLFEAINEDELKTKLQETIESMQNIFDLSGNMEDFPEMDTSGTGSNNIPNAEEIHNHINGMMEGKLGKLAMELAEETAKDLNVDMENVTDANGVFQKLFKNPGKLMNMIKNVGDKIDSKIKSGELKESELISEGMEMLNKMKNMPGMGNMQEMFSKLGIPGLGKGGKINMSAMEAQMNKNLKLAKMKERMRNKVSSETAKQTAHSNNVSQLPGNSSLTEEQLISIFSTGETVEKTPRGAKPNNTNKKNKSKK